MNPIEVSTLRSAWELIERSRTPQELRLMVAATAQQLGLSEPKGDWLEEAAGYARKGDIATLNVLWARFLAKSHERLEDLEVSEVPEPLPIQPGVADISWQTPLDSLL